MVAVTIHNDFGAQVCHWQNNAFYNYSHIPTYEYLTFHWKKDFVDVMKFSIFVWGLAWIVHIGFITGRQEGQSGRRKFDDGISHSFYCFPIYLPWRDGTRCHDLHILNVEFEASFSLSFFTFIKKPFNSSSLSVMRVVSSTYLRLNIW